MQTSGFFNGSLIIQTPLNRFYYLSARIAPATMLSLYTHINVLVPMHRLPEDTVPQHAEPHKRQRDLPRKKDAANARRHIGKGVPHAANDKVLERAGDLDKGAAPLVGDEQPVAEEGVGEAEYYILVNLYFSTADVC